MLAKNAIVFKLAGAIPPDLNERLKSRAFNPPGSFDAKSTGFIVASPDYGTFTRKAGVFTGFVLRTDVKVIPSSALKQATAEAAQAFESDNGYKPGRKAMRELKDGALERLREKAMCRTSTVRGWFDHATQWLVVDTPSQARAEDVLEQLMAADALPPVVKMWRTNLGRSGQMGVWVENDTPPAGMTIDDRAKARDHNGGVIAVSDRPATSGEMVSIIAEGCTVMELGMTLEGVASFVLTESGAIKRMTLAVGEESPQGERLTREEEENADLILSGTAVSQILDALTLALGGIEGGE